MLRLLKNIATACLLAAATQALCAQTYNYSDVLNKGIVFYDANRCGTDVTVNSVFNWRGNCHVQDQSLTGVDMTGGYHDAGDYLKMGLNQAYTPSLLGWSLYEYRSTYDATGNTAKLLSTLKRFTDYFIKCHPNSGVFYYEVGLDSDHDTWRPPENDTGIRTCPNDGHAYWVDSTHAGSDICGETAAALALMSINYQSTDASYAAQCLQAAKEIYTLGKNVRGVGRSNQDGTFYPSSGYYDHLAWGALWLNIATGTSGYMTDALSFLSSNPKPVTDPLGWDSVVCALNLKLYQMTGTTSYKSAVQSNLNAWKTWTKTPGGLYFYSADDPLVYTIDEAFIAMHYQKATGDTTYRTPAVAQLNYVLGSNPRSSSYVIGFGSNWPVHVQHSAANGYVDSTMSSTSAWNNPPMHLLTGAMVGGPAADDSYQDNVANYQQSEPAIDYNAGLVALVASYVAQNGTNFTITASAGAGGSITPTGSVAVAQGANQTFSITPSAGYAVTSVTVDGSSVGAVTSYTFSNVQANHTIAAAFSATSTNFTITATAGTGGTISPSGGVSVAQGANQSFTIAANSGYTISSVTVDGASVGAVSTYTFSNVQANHTIAAAFSSSGGTTTALNDTATGITFTGTWSYSSARGLGDYSDDVHYTKNNGDSVSYTFTGTGIDYVTEKNTDEGNISFYIDGVLQTTVSANSASRQVQQVLYSATGLTNASHTFKAVKQDATYMLLDELIVHQAATVTYTITASAGAGGTISPSGSVSVNQGANQSFSIAANAGYLVSSVTVDGASVGAVTSYTFSNVQANHTISAAFVAAPTYTITASAGANGTISPSGSVSVAQGANQTFTISANSGYTISAVTVDGTSVGAVTTYTFSNVQANHTVSASFTANPTYTITSSAGTGGTISPSGTVSVAQGANQSFTIAANSGYTISDVAVDGSSVGAVSTYTFTNVTANHTIAASFAASTGGLPSGWTDTDIGAPSPAGGASYSGGAFTISGSGSDIWGTADQLNYASVATSGDTTITARVAAVQNTNAWAKAGVMFRESTAAGASYIGLYVTPANGVSMQYRNGTGTSAVDLARIAGNTAPYWVRLVRSANTFTGYCSPDGITWTQVGSISVTMSASATAGLPVCSHSAGVLCTATVDNVSVTTAVSFTITATAGTGGTVSPSGTVSVAQGANQTFTITANSGYTIASVTVDGASVGAVTTYTFGNVQANHTISASFSGSTSDTNIAPNGTAYGWNANTSSTANTNKSAQPGLNDGNLTNNVDLDSAGDAVGAWEAAGVTWTSTKTISSVNFINGDITTGGDGYLTASLTLQFTTDGSTWTNSGWSVSPAYPYSSAAGGQTYTFTGTAVSGVLGARVVGQVRTTDTSYHWIVKEVQTIGH